MLRTKEAPRRKPHAGRLITIAGKRPARPRRIRNERPNALKPALLARITLNAGMPALVQ
jgi:hypothetical protein